MARKQNRELDTLNRLRGINPLLADWLKSGEVPPRARRGGFTIVELLIVIVVIGILAAISIVAYNGIQQRARDTQRLSDVAVIEKALEMYYLDHGRYPDSSGSTTINEHWSTTDDASWGNLESQLVPDYISELPKDPVSAPGRSPISDNAKNLNYAYFKNPASYCQAEPHKMYILVYKFEARSQTSKYVGECPSNGLSYAVSSNLRVVKE